MSEQPGEYKTRTRGHLALVRPAAAAVPVAPAAAVADPAVGTTAGGAERAPIDPAGVLGRIVMHAAMAWVSACMERDAHTIDVAPVGPGLFDATARLVGGGDVFLRVATELTVGPRLVVAIEPLHP